MAHKSVLLSLFIVVLSGCASVGRVSDTRSGGPNNAQRVIEDMPPIEREFRAAWVATVDNIDWPSEPGLPVYRQKQEMLELLDRAVMLGLNAIIFQVRPTADALYDSALEPWSYYLTGQNGLAPRPYYDPLSFAVEEAHRRGLELHAWFNPYRAYHPTAPLLLSDSHVSGRFPEAVHTYGSLMWMDPGSARATDHTIAVIMDVVERYDIDGVHLDDYFYPYSINDEDGNRVEFPDSTFYAVYGGGLSRSDWRRRNVNDLIQRLYSGIKESKPWVLFGISPFGIWRPGYPDGVTGFDAHENLFADARKWLRQGWVDYFTPQLYWALDSSAQPYAELLSWWVSENRRNRHIWPGNYTSRIILEGASYWETDEVVNQVRQTRAQAGATGNVHFSMRAMMPAGHGMGKALASSVYTTKAVAPRTTWLKGAKPATPGASIEDLGSQIYLSMTPGDSTQIRNWILRIREGTKWTMDVIPAWHRTLNLSSYKNADVIVLQSITRLGLESEPVVLFLKQR